LVWNRELPAGDLAAAMPDVTFGAVSLHLKALRDSGAVVVRVDGKQRLYRANRERLKHVASVLQHMWDDSLWRLKLLAEFEQTRRGPAPQRRRKKP
jgi:DNA-binding transcriptional ArsR family regulator